MRDLAAGYEAAAARCPKILKPIGEIKTASGKRLRHTLVRGGLMTE